MRAMTECPVRQMGQQILMGHVDHDLPLDPAGAKPLNPITGYRLL